MPSPVIYLIRHGATEWALNGRHTGRTDIPLTDEGREQAELFIPVFTEVDFSLVLSSPRQRARETARLAGLEPKVEITDDLCEWDYGDYEGLTTQEIQRAVPGWTVFTHPCPNGETEAQVAARADRVIARCRQMTGNVALFGHGHILRVLATRWIGLPTVAGQHFLLGTSTLSILAFDRGTPAIRTWNGPLLTSACAVPWRHAHAAK